jgi:hypothetical protein
MNAPLPDAVRPPLAEVLSDEPRVRSAHRQPTPATADTASARRLVAGRSHDMTR